MLWGCMGEFVSLWVAVLGLQDKIKDNFVVRTRSLFLATIDVESESALQLRVILAPTFVEQVSPREMLKTAVACCSGTNFC